jgi:hypothetical protein
MSPACVPWRGTQGVVRRVVVPARQAGNRFLGSLKGLQIRTLYFRAGGGDSFFHLEEQFLPLDKLTKLDWSTIFLFISFYHF